MKVWIGHGSEHSYNLVMIGRFADETKARTAEQKFEQLRKAAESELGDLGWEADQRLTAGIRAILDELKMWDLSRSDIENFAYSHTVQRDGKELRIGTDEGEVEGFLKVLIGGGAKIEIYSAHEWTDDGEPRVTEAPTHGEAQAGGESV